MDDRGDRVVRVCRNIPRVVVTAAFVGVCCKSICKLLNAAKRSHREEGNRAPYIEE